MNYLKLLGKYLWLKWRCNYLRGRLEIELFKYHGATLPCFNCDKIKRWKRG